MKNLITLFLVILNTHYLFGQEVIKVSEPIFLENKAIEEVKLVEQTLDEIRHKGQLVYAKRKTENDTIEYFKVDDMLYFFRQASREYQHNEGYYKIGSQFNRIDSILSFDPETFQEKIMVVSYFRTQKHGKWKETFNDSTYWQGGYEEGKRTGRWFKSLDKINFHKYGEFHKDELITLYNPDIKDIEKNIHWISNKPFTLCSISYTDLKATDTEYWWLETEDSEDCYNFGEIKFQKNGMFEYKHNSQYQIDIKKFDGKGDWQINDEGFLLIEFQNKEKESFIIEELSPNKIRLKKISS